MYLLEGTTQFHEQWTGVSKSMKQFFFGEILQLGSTGHGVDEQDEDTP
jgi:hypothetical protein